MRTKRVAWITLLGVIASIALIGCGGSDDSSSDEPTAAAEDPAPAPPTMAAYIKSADQICSESSKQAQKRVDRQIEIDKEVAAGVPLARLKELYNEASTLTGERVVIRQKATKELEALEPPAEGAATRYLKVRAAATELVEDVADALADYADDPNDSTGNDVTAAIKKANVEAAKEEKAAEDFGFKVCGQPAKRVKPLL